MLVADPHEEALAVEPLQKRLRVATAGAESIPQRGDRDGPVALADGNDRRAHLLHHIGIEEQVRATSHDEPFVGEPPELTQLVTPGNPRRLEPRLAYEVQQFRPQNAIARTLPPAACRLRSAVCRLRSPVSGLPTIRADTQHHPTPDRVGRRDAPDDEPVAWDRDQLLLEEQLRSAFAVPDTCAVWRVPWWS